MMSENVHSLQPGLTGTATLTVAEIHTAASMGSGRLPILATPALVTLMEAAARVATDSHLPPDWQSVGTRLDIRHEGATPVGMTVVAEAELVAVTGRLLTFRVTARDDAGTIGEGRHERTMSSMTTFSRLLRQKKQRFTKGLSNTDSAETA